MATLYSVDGVAAANVRGYGRIGGAAPTNICYNPECYSYNGVVISGSGQNISTPYAMLPHPATNADFERLKLFYLNKSTLTVSSGNVLSDASVTIAGDYHAIVMFVTINIPANWRYQFGIDCSDAGEGFLNGTWYSNWYWYGSHNVSGGWTHSTGWIYMTAGTHYIVAYQEKVGTTYDGVLKLSMRKENPGHAHTLITTSNYATSITYDLYTFIRP